MGGRTSASGMGVPKMNNPAGVPSNAMTEQEFLSLRGVGDSVSGAGVDMIGSANQTRMTEKQRQKVQAKIDAERDDYYARRQAAREEYKSLVDSGKIRDKPRLNVYLQGRTKTRTTRLLRPQGEWPRRGA